MERAEWDIYRALFLKSATFQIRQHRTNCCQIAFSVMMVAVLILITNLDYTPYTYDPSWNDQNNTQFTTWYRWPYESDQYYGRFVYYDPNNIASEIMENGYQPWLTYRQDVLLFNGTTPALLQVNSSQDILNEYTYYAQQLASLTTWGAGSNQTLLATAEFKQITAGLTFDEISDKRLAYTVQTTPIPLPYYSYFTTMRVDQYFPFVSNWINNAFLKPITGLNSTINTVLQGFSWYRFYTPFTPGQIASVMALFLLPATLVFILPVFVFTIVYEKQERLVEMMKMNGISSVMYWLSSFTFCYLVYLVMMVIVVVLGAIGQLDFFVKPPPATYLILFLLFGFAQASFAFVISTLFSKAKTASLASYFIVMALVGIGGAQFSIFTLDTAPWPVMILPLYAMERGVFLICFSTTGPHPPDMLSFSHYSLLSECYLYLFFETFAYFALAMYLDKVVPRAEGVRYSPLFPFLFLRSWYKSKYAQKIKEEKTSILAAETDGGEEENMLEKVQHAEDDVATLEFEDSECVAERHKAHSKQAYMLKSIDLQKTYPAKSGHPAKHALVKFCLALEEGECLGLLGPNGAGKSTLISILCGLTAPTSGTAFVSQFDITKEMYNVHKILGYCPQHDILWQDLTVQEHLLFYCRLRGYNHRNEMIHVNKIATDVGLGGPHIHKKVSELSGGMKRRLSIAIALVGDSRLVLLDEPTTGLDPDTRRNVWDIIEATKAKRSIIITTHNIDEADVLCTKIAIMSLGRLKCIGSSQYLKNKFGAGYKLCAHIAHGSEEKYIEWVKSTFRQADQDMAAGTIDFVIPSAEMDVSRVFGAMKRYKDSLGVIEWSLNQMSLEEVFLKMVAEDEAQL